MKVVLQRVKNAKCTVDGKITGQIECGYLLLVGYTHTDTDEINQKMAKKIANLRIFEDENGKMNLDIKKVNGKILSISQFTLYANTNEGNRPSFVNISPCLVLLELMDLILIELLLIVLIISTTTLFLSYDKIEIKDS